MSSGDRGRDQRGQQAQRPHLWQRAADGIKGPGTFAGYAVSIITFLGFVVAAIVWLPGALSGSSPPSISDRLATLGPGLQLRAFSKELGPPDVERTIGRFKWVTFVHPAFYVTAIVETDGTVGLFSVTARDHSQPIHVGGVTLCRTHLSQGPSPFSINIRDYYWVEMHEQHPHSPDVGEIPQPYDYLGVNPAALPCSNGARPLVRAQAGDSSLSGEFGYMEGIPPAIARLRTQLIANTYARASRQFSEHWDVYSGGPQSGQSPGVPVFYIGPNPEEVKYLGKR